MREQNRNLFFIVIALALLCVQPARVWSAVRDIQPFPQQVQVTGELPLLLPAQLRIAITDHNSPPRWKSQLVPDWLLLQSEISSLFQNKGFATPAFIDPDSLSTDSVEVIIQIGADSFVDDAKQWHGISTDSLPYPLETYRINTSGRQIQIDATEIRAAHWAVLTLLDLLRAENDSLFVQRVDIIDWPDFPVRVATINGSLRDEQQIAVANRIADLAYYAKFNEIEWNNNDAGRADEKRGSRVASLMLRKTISRRAQRLSMSVDRTGYTVENPAWQEAIPVLSTPLIVRDTLLVLDSARCDIDIENRSFESRTDDPDSITSWIPTPSAFADHVIFDTLRAKSGDHSLCITAGDTPFSGGLLQVIEIEPFQYLNLRLWYQAEDFQGLLWVRAQEAETRKPNDALMQVKRLDNCREWTPVDLKFSTFGMHRIRLIIGVKRMSSGKLWLDDLALTQAFPEYIIRRPDTPLSLFNTTTDEPLQEHTAYSIVETTERSNPDFIHTPAFLLTDHSHLKNGDRLALNWHCGVKFQQHRETVCFSLREPLAEYAERLRTVEQFLYPEAYNIHIDEVSYAGYDSLCRGSGKSPAQLVGEYCRAMYDSIQVVHPQAAVRTYGDAFDINVHDVRMHPVDYRPWIAGIDGESSLSFLPRDIQIMAMADYSRNLDSSFTFFDRLGFKAVVALMLDTDITSLDRHMLTGSRYDNCLGVQLYGWHSASFEVLPRLSYLGWNMKPAVIAYAPSINDSSIVFHIDTWCHSISEDSLSLIDSVLFQYSYELDNAPRSMRMTTTEDLGYSCSLNRAESSDDHLSYRFIAYDKRQLIAESPPHEFAPYTINIPHE